MRAAGAARPTQVAPYTATKTLAAGRTTSSSWRARQMDSVLPAQPCPARWCMKAHAKTLHPGRWAQREQQLARQADGQPAAGAAVPRPPGKQKSMITPSFS